MHPSEVVKEITRYVTLMRALTGDLSPTLLVVLPNL